MQVHRLPLMWLLLSALAAAQSPFQFREAALLEGRMFRSGAEYTTGHEQIVGRIAPSPAMQFIPDPNDPNVYTSARWLGLLNETDQYRRRGALRLAERQYLDLLAKLRKYQGAESVDVGWMLDHLGEFYLSVHDFEKARQYFSDAIVVRKANLQSAESSKQEKELAVTCQAHLIKLQLMVGRLDMGKGDLAQAEQELGEAVAGANKLVRLDYGLHAIYFDSLLLEKQGRWQEAEAVWQQATSVRQKMTISDPYWDLMKEMAAFYARKGDYNTAADLVQRIQTATAGKRLRPVLSIPNSLASRQEADDELQRWQAFYPQESEFAMAEILAVNRWITDGPEAAASMLVAKPMIRLPESDSIDAGSDAERARLLAFMTRRAWLNMSILLDGNPTPQRTNQAFKALQAVQGRYLDSIATLTRATESLRGNPNVSFMEGIGPVEMLDELAKQRTHYAHTFVSAALDGNKFSDVDFAASEQAEQTVLEALAYSERDRYNVLVEGDVGSLVPAGQALINFAAWERTSRTAPATAQREYGAFVTTTGQTVYVKLAPAAAIDSEIAALESAVVGPHLRGVAVAEPVQSRVQQMKQRLRRLYDEVIAPLQPSLHGVNKLLIVPDGKLALAPVAAFTDAHGQYLLQRYTVAYLNSWRQVFEESVEGDAPNAPVIVANPDFDLALPNSEKLPLLAGRLPFKALPGAELEAQDVQQALHLRQDRVLTGKAAREQTIHALTAPEILHFATHSVPDLQWKIPTPAYDLFEYPKSLATDDPLLESVIVLAGGDRPQAGPEDGLLTGLEVASLRLSGTRLVVLSTCEAGQGTPVDGQGVLGLRAAFSMAGAQGLVMSLWPIDDRAGRQFMQFFYSHVKEGPAEAIRLSQLDMISKTAFNEPVYWAGYAYSGDPGLSKAVRPTPQSSASRKSRPGGDDTPMTAPTCIEFETRSADKYYRNRDIYRLMIAGALNRVSAAPDKVVYRLIPPASNLEESHLSSVNGGPEQEMDSRSANGSKFPVEVAVERNEQQSTFTIREYVAEGDYRHKPQDVLLITLKGPAGVLTGFDIPAAFPGLNSFSEATLSRGGQKPVKIDQLGTCPAR